MAGKIIGAAVFQVKRPVTEEDTARSGLPLFLSAGVFPAIPLGRGFLLFGAGLDMYPTERSAAGEDFLGIGSSIGDSLNRIKIEAAAGYALRVR